jgi:hypothetical protein
LALPITGKYQDVPAATACIDCAPGHWCSFGQQSACVRRRQTNHQLMAVHPN